MIKNRQKIQNFRILLHRFRSVQGVSYEPSYLKNIIGNKLVLRIRTGTLIKMIKKSSKNAKFSHPFASFSVGLRCILMNHPTTILPKKYDQEYIGFTNTHRYADENDQKIFKKYKIYAYFCIVFDRFMVYLHEPSST